MITVTFTNDVHITVTSYELLPGWVKLAMGGKDVKVVPASQVKCIDETHKAGTPPVQEGKKINYMDAFNPPVEEEEHF